MNTDACNEEDMNIPISKSVCPCLLSHSLKIVFAFFALDHSAHSRMTRILATFLISATVQEHILPSSTRNLSVCCANTTGRPVLSSINSSDFHSWEDQVLSTFHVEQLDEKAFTTGRPVLWCCSVREVRWNWLSCLVFPRAFCVGFTSVKNTVCLSLLECCLPLSILNLWWSANWLHIQYDKKVLDEIVRNKHIVLWWRINGIASRMTLKSSEVKNFLSWRINTVLKPSSRGRSSWFCFSLWSACKSKHFCLRFRSFLFVVAVLFVDQVCDQLVSSMRNSDPRVRIVCSQIQFLFPLHIYLAVTGCDFQHGSIRVFPRIQPFGSDDFSSLGSVHSRQATESVNCENSSACFVMKYCPTSTVFKNPASVHIVMNRSCCGSLSTRSSILSSEQDWCRPNIPCSDVSSMLYACIMHDAVHSSRSYQDPYGFCPWDPQTERRLSVCCSKFVLPVSIPNWWWNVNWLHIRHDKCTGRSCSEWPHCPAK